MAVQIVSRVARSFQLGPDLRALFDTPTIADMARLVTEHLVSQMDPALLGYLLDELDPDTPFSRPPGWQNLQPLQ